MKEPVSLCPKIVNQLLFLITVSKWSLNILIMHVLFYVLIRIISGYPHCNINEYLLYFIFCYVNGVTLVLGEGQFPLT